jgi:hypothetical protein
MTATQYFTVTVNQPAAPQLNGASITNGQFAMWLSGDAGPDYVIQTSTNLASWSNLVTLTPAAMPCWWTDTNAAAFPSLFYRVVLGP